MERTLVLLIRVLNHSGINAAARLAPDGRVGVWLGDGDEGGMACAFFDMHELFRAVEWLKGQALAAYPDSAFARQSKAIAALVHGARSGTQA